MTHRLNGEEENIEMDMTPEGSIHMTPEGSVNESESQQSVDTRFERAVSELSNPAYFNRNYRFLFTLLTDDFVDLYDDSDDFDWVFDNLEWIPGVFDPATTMFMDFNVKREIPRIPIRKDNLLWDFNFREFLTRLIVIHVILVIPIPGRMPLILEPTHVAELYQYFRIHVVNLLNFAVFLVDAYQTWERERLHHVQRLKSLQSNRLYDRQLMRVFIQDVSFESYLNSITSLNLRETPRGNMYQSLLHAFLHKLDLEIEFPISLYRKIMRVIFTDLFEELFEMLDGDVSGIQFY